MTKNKILIPEARKGLTQFKEQVMSKRGYHAKSESELKYEVAKDLAVPLTKGDNGELTSKQAGQVGGQIGGSMVQEMIKMAKTNLASKD